MRRALLFACLFGLLGLEVRAQDGKIAGKVIDKRTGEPLPGATVLIVGTTRGAATDARGEYFILNVPPGRYTLRASFVGYQEQIRQDVVVNSGFTTIVNFELSEGVQVLGEVVVQGERLIRQDETTSAAVLSGEQIQNLPVQNIFQAMTTTAGFVATGPTGDSGIHLRGGRSREIAYMVDGVIVKDPLFGGIGGLNLPTQAVSELQILSGGFNAEYGEAMSGVVLINTPVGGPQYRGTLQLRTDGFSTGGMFRNGPYRGTRSWDNDWGTRDVEFVLSGPIPLLGRRASFFGAINRFESDTYLNRWTGPKRPAVLPWSQVVGLSLLNDVTVGSLRLKKGDKVTEDVLAQLRQAGVNVDSAIVAVSDYQMRHNFQLFDDQTRATLNLGLQLSRDIDLKLGAKLTRWLYRQYAHRLKEFPQYNGTNRREVDLYNVAFTHRISPSVFYELKYAYHRNWSAYYVYEEQLDPNNPNRFNRIWAPARVNGAFNTEGLPPGQGGGSNYEFWGFTQQAIHLQDPNLFDGDLGQPYQLGRDYDLNGDGKPEYRRGQRLSPEMVNAFRAAGMNAIIILAPPTDNTFDNRKSVEHQIKFDITAQVNKNNLVKMGLELRRFNLSTEYIPSVNSLWDHSNPAQERRHDWEEYYDVSPIQAAAYIQDKIEFSNLVLQLGLRFDYLDPRIWAIKGYEQGADPTRGKAETEPARKKWKLSPRIGVAFPVTERARLSFSYGQFFQYPDYFQMYNRLRTKTWVPGQGYVPVQGEGFDLLGYEPRIGNPNLSPETTIAYQIDAEFALTDYSKLGISLFYKDIYDYVSVKRIDRGAGTAYWILYNADYANAKGFEVTFERRFTGNFGLQASYTYSRAIGNADNFEERFNEAYLASVYGIVPPRMALPLSWDQPHTLAFTAQAGLGRLRANLVGRFGSGLPYTPTTPRGKPTGDKNSARQPWTSTVDLRLQYEWTSGRGFYVQPFVDISNLFNKRNVLRVFSDTGAPDATLDPGLSPEYVDRPHYFGPPRHILFGVRMGF
jgi:outer membrane receptor protein involved in Fe transport